MHYDFYFLSFLFDFVFGAARNSTVDTTKTIKISTWSVTCHCVCLSVQLLSYSMDLKSAGEENYGRYSKVFIRVIFCHSHYSFFLSFFIVPASILFYAVPFCYLH